MCEGGLAGREMNFGWVLNSQKQGRRMPGGGVEEAQNRP
jgi:hypothetical protein